jgi:hypothetical protein
MKPLNSKIHCPEVLGAAGWLRAWTSSNISFGIHGPTPIYSPVLVAFA